MKLLFYNRLKKMSEINWLPSEHNNYRHMFDNPEIFHGKSNCNKCNKPYKIVKSDFRIACSPSTQKGVCRKHYPNWGYNLDIDLHNKILYEYFTTCDCTIGIYLDNDVIHIYKNHL